MSADQADVVIVGMGPSGIILAKELATAGLQVVALERGPWRSRPDYQARDDLRWAVRTDLLPTVRDDPLSVRLSSDQRAAVVRTTSPENQVGGAFLHWGGWSWRFHPDDFKVRTNEVESGLAERAGADLSGTDVQDWPLTYEELAPYYERFEWEFGIAGARGANPFAAPMARDYPVPPLRGSGRYAILEPAIQGHGYHPFPGLSGILSRPYKPPAPFDTRIPARPACTYCSYCSGVACHVGAKSSASEDLLPAALETGRLDLRTGCRVVRVNTDARGLASGVTYLDADGTRQDLDAPLVILANFVQEIVRLLLLSTSDRHPAGLANSSGLVGKYYMTQGYVFAYGDYDDRIVNGFIGPSSAEVAMDDYYGNNFDHTGVGFIRGANIRSSGHGTPVRLYNEIPPDVPRWGLAYREYLQRYYTRHLGLVAECESLPHANNSIDLDPDHRDRWGVPLARVTWNFTENDRRMHHWMVDRLEEVVRASGASKVWTRWQLAGPGPHPAGGTRMGADPATSVTDSYGQTWDVPNLLVTGSSLYPTMSGYNPTEHLGALAYRTADAIVRRQLVLPRA